MTAVKTTVGARGRVTVPAAVQREAGVLEGDEVVVRVAGPGVVVVESVKAIKDRIRAAAPPGGRFDAVADVRADRDRDAEARHEQHVGQEGSPPEPADAGGEDPGAEMLRSLGL